MKTLPYARIIKQWLPIAFLSACLCGLVYISAQQNLRQSANDPQIQIATDVASALEAGVSPSTIIPSGSQPIDMTKTLDSYVLIFDDAGTLVAGNASLNGKPPAPPHGVFDYARNTGEDRITWAPAPGVRSAIIVERVTMNGANVGFVVVGRSLKEVEMRESELTNETGAIFLLTLIGTFILTAIAALW